MTQMASKVKTCHISSELAGVVTFLFESVKKHHSLASTINKWRIIKRGKNKVGAKVNLISNILLYYEVRSFFFHLYMEIACSISGTSCFSSSFFELSLFFNGKQTWFRISLSPSYWGFPVVALTVCETHFIRLLYLDINSMKVLKITKRENKNMTVKKFDGSLECSLAVYKAPGLVEQIHSFQTFPTVQH